MAIAAPAHASIVFGCSGFTSAAAGNSISGQYLEGVSAAAGWNLWNNSAAVTTSVLVDQFEGRENDLHVVTSGASNGAFRFFAGAATSGYADFWVATG